MTLSTHRSHECESARTGECCSPTSVRLPGRPARRGRIHPAVEALRVPLLVVFLLLSFGVFASAQLATGVIQTIAGIPGSGGTTGNGGSALNAQLNEPIAVAFDASGNMYVADYANCAIRKVSAGTRVITTVAGILGQCGYSGDGGPATSALLSSPWGIAFDSTGNLYLSDAGNNVIRKVSAADGTISTVAGIQGESGYNGDGIPAAAAWLGYPLGLAFDSADNLYIADYQNNVVREVSAETGYISTVAGIPQIPGCSGDDGPAINAGLGGPTGVALDPQGNLYIADYADHLIRQVLAGSGIISTAAGSPCSAGYSGDGGYAFGAQLNGPTDVKVDAAGNLFIADIGNAIIREVSASTGNINTVAGTPQAAGFGGDGGPATSAQLYGPYGIGLDSNGNLYIADALNEVVREVGGLGGVAPPQIGTAEGSATVPGDSSDGAYGQVYIYGGGHFNSGVQVRSITWYSNLSGGASLITPILFEQTGTSPAVYTIRGVGATVNSTNSTSPQTAPFVLLYGTDKTTNGNFTWGFVNSSVNASGVQGATSAGAVDFTSNNLTGPGVGGEGTTNEWYFTPSSFGPSITLNLGYGFGLGGGGNFSLYTGGARNYSAFMSGSQASGTALSAAPNPSIAGQNVTFTATVTPSDATGTVTFLDGTTTLGTGTLNGAVATYSTAALSPGTHSITAVYGGDRNYPGSTSAAVSQTVGGASQSISFSALPNEAFGTAPFSVSATASSELPVSFASTTSTTCSVSGAIVTLLALGTCTIEATQPGDSNYAAAAPVDQSFTVTQGSQTISFGTQSARTYGAAPFTISATATSGLPVTFATVNTLINVQFGNGGTPQQTGPGAIGNSGDTWNLLKGTGGNGVTGSNVAVVDSKGNPSPVTVSWNGTGLYNNGPGAFTGTPWANLVYGYLYFFGGTPKTLTIAGLTPNAGYSLYMIAQPGAPSRPTQFAVNGGSPVSTDGSNTANTMISGKNYALLNVTADGTGVLNVAMSALSSEGDVNGFQLTGTSACSVSGATVTLLAPGTCTIQATQAGNANYAAATPVNQSFTVNPPSTTSYAGPDLGDGAWRTASRTKPLDPDGDNVYGTAGYDVLYSQNGNLQSLPTGVSVTQLAPGLYPGNGGYTVIDNPATPGSTIISGVGYFGGITPGAAYDFVSVSFSANAKYVMGIYSDNTDYAGISPSALRVYQVSGGTADSGLITTAGTRNGDWYFFNISANAGDVFHIQGIAQSSPPGSSGIGIVTFDSGQGKTFQTITFAQPASVDLLSGPVTLMATAPGGPVSFASKTTAVCTVNGSTVTLVAAGTCTIEATQAGNTTYSAAAPVDQSFTVTSAVTTTTLSAAPNPSRFGQSVTFTATVTVTGGGGPTGTVTFKDGTTTLGTGTLANGVATYSTATLSVATHAVTAAYGGDTHYMASTSTALNQVVNQIPVTATVTSSANPATLGQPVTLTTTVSPSAATGSVTFYDGTNVLGTGTLSAGQAKLTTSLLPSGTRSITARYNGAPGYAPTAAAALPLTVNVLLESGFAAEADRGTAAQPRAVAVADFNGDGHADLAVANSGAGNVSILLGNGDGTFAAPVNYTTAAGPVAIVTGDFNGDGKTDIATAGSGISVLAGNGNGTFGAASGYAAGSAGLSTLAAADFNGDGIIDLATASASGNAVYVLTGAGNGTFGSAASLTVQGSPQSIAAADFNGDGKADIVAANTQGTIAILAGNGDGTFQTAASKAAGQSLKFVAAGDLNGDGFADLVAADASGNNVVVLLGKGDGTFQAAVSYAAGTAPQSVAIGDFNGDNKADLAVVSTGAVTLFFGNGDGTFTAGPTQTVNGTPVNLSVSDLNGDGRSDLVVVNQGTATPLPGVSVFLGSVPTPSVSCQTATRPLAAGLTYSQSCPATGGQAPYTWSVSSGSLPAGITLDPASGLLSGTPSATGTSTFTLRVVDSDTPAQSASVNVTLVVASALSLAKTLPSGTQGVPYSATLATGGLPPVSCSVFGGGTVPPGLQLNATPCSLAGSPTAGGTYNFVVTATDGATPPQSATQTYTVTISFQPLQITTSTLPKGQIGTAYGPVTLSASGGSGSFSWSATGLPAGLTLSAGGVLSGTPTASYTGNVSVTVNDTQANSSATQTLALTVVYPPLTITTTSLPNGQAGVAYGPVTLAATGGSTKYTWAATGLPTGLKLSAAGVLSGTPTSLSSSVTFTVTDTTAAATAVQSLTLTVTALPLLISGPASLGSVATGQAVSGAYTATGGLAPYNWSLAGAPAGITIDAGGKLSGSLATPGSSGFTVQVTDALSTTATVSVSVSAFGILTTSLPSASTLTTYNSAITIAGGTAPFSYAATGLPDGLSLNGGTLTGQAVNPGTATITIVVTDAKGLSATVSYSLTVTGPGPLAIPKTALPDGTAGTPYSQTLTATGGQPPYTWSLTGGALPAGFSISPAGVVSGLSNDPGTASFGVQVVDTNGTTKLATISLNIVAAPLVITNGASLPNAMALVDYPGQILAATGGTAPYTFGVTGTLPPGLSLSGGQISGSPTTAGTYSFTLTVADSATPPLSGSLKTQILVKPNSPDLVISTNSASFTLVSGSSDVPSSNNVNVRSSVASQAITFTTSVNPPAPWLTVSAGGSTPTGVSIGLSAASLALTSKGSPYTTTVVVTCKSTACAGNSQSIGVTLGVTDLPPVLRAGPDLISFTASAADPQPSSQQISIQDAGGGTIQGISVTAADPWLTIGPLPAAVQPGPGASINVTANPAGLSAGFYRSTIFISTSAGTSAVPVNLLISAGGTMTLGPSGSQFSMPQGGAPGNPSGSFLVSVSSSTNVNYSASVLPGASWLRLGNGAGSATGSSPGTVTFSIDPAAAAALATGAFYGTIRVTASGVVNSPQDYQVILNVAPATKSVAIDPEPAGLLFLSGGTAGLPAQTIQVFAASPAPLTYQAAATVDDGSGWLSISPSAGSASALSPGKVAVSVNPAGLSAGVHRGRVTFGASSSAVPAVNVTVVVSPSLAGGATSFFQPNEVSETGTSRQLGTTCSSPQLAPTQTGLVNSFSAPASWPTPLAITLVDTCGTLVGNGQIITTFSNGDPPLILNPIDTKHGLYSGTWTPRKSAAQVTIAARATAPGYSAASVQIGGQVVPNAAPVLNPNGTTDIFHPQVGGGLGPGNIVQIYGANLANQPATPSSLPLPTALTGTSVLIGGVQAPLYYVSPTQINAQIPFELTPGNQYQLIVSANGALTTPEPIQLNTGTPAVLQFTSGEVEALHADGSLISDTSPAAPGESIVIFLTGLGATDISVPSGAAAPSSPLANVLNVPVLTLNGNPAPVQFAGLTPGLVGLYQINFQVPAGLAPGNIQLAITQNGVQSNVAVLPVGTP